jgi:multidrug efflux pump subunit AcrA (membrane-fusion protein)
VRADATVPLLTISNLDTVWVLADVYEQDLVAVRVGSPAAVRAAAVPGHDLKGTVTFVTPAVDPATRTVKVRLEVDNPGLALLPEMLVEVTLDVGRGRGLVVPESAVLDSGERRLVFLDPRDLAGGSHCNCESQRVSESAGSNCELWSDSGGSISRRRIDYPHFLLPARRHHAPGRQFVFSAGLRQQCRGLPR